MDIYSLTLRQLLVNDNDTVAGLATEIAYLLNRDEVVAVLQLDYTSTRTLRDVKQPS